MISADESLENSDLSRKKPFLGCSKIKNRRIQGTRSFQWNAHTSPAHSRFELDFNAKLMEIVRVAFCGLKEFQVSLCYWQSTDFAFFLSLGTFCSAKLSNRDCHLIGDCLANSIKALLSQTLKRFASQRLLLRAFAEFERLAKVQCLFRSSCEPPAASEDIDCHCRRSLNLIQLLKVTSAWSHSARVLGEQPEFALWSR